MIYASCSVLTLMVYWFGDRIDIHFVRNPSTTPAGSIVAQVEEENLRGNWLEKRP